MENLSRYKLCTEKADWRGICEINGVNFDSFGTNKELAALSGYLEPGEVVFALSSGLMNQTVTSNAFDLGVNTWLVVLTSERFLFLDAALLTSSIDTQSIRLNKVQAISASQGFALGKISIDLGSRLITIDNCTKESVKVMADLANKWLKDLENGVKIPEDSPEMEAFKKKANDTNMVRPPIAPSKTANRTAAALVAAILGWSGLHSYIWGKWQIGWIKGALSAASYHLWTREFYTLSALLMLIVVIWILVDLIHIYDGSFFSDAEPLPMANGLQGFLSLVYLILVVYSGYSVVTNFIDSRKKDNGKLASIREIVDTYNKNEAAAENSFDGPMFTIAGAVRSVEKDPFWGDYTVKFEGLGPFNIFNLGSKVTEIELTFPKKQKDDLLKVRKGDVIAATCIGRGLSVGTYSANRCKLKAVKRK